MNRLRASEIYNGSRLKLIAVESVDFRQTKHNAYFHLSGKIEPLAIIVCSADTTYALDLQASSVDINQFRENIPELDAMIALNKKA